MAAGVGWDGQEVPHAAGEQPLENNLVASVTWMMPQAVLAASLWHVPRGHMALGRRHMRTLLEPWCMW